MGLDWLPGPKPKPGCEVEVTALRQQLSRWFCWGRKKKQARLDDLMVDPIDALGAPMVGRDAAANEWARQKFDQRNDQSLDMAG